VSTTPPKSKNTARNLDADWVDEDGDDDDDEAGEATTARSYRQDVGRREPGGGRNDRGRTTVGFRTFSLESATSPRHRG
jgi:hypothetical protein